MRDGTYHTHGVNKSITRVTAIGPKRVYMKPKYGLGRKHAKWVSVLYEYLLGQFDSPRKLGVRFNMVMIKHIAFDLFHNSTNGAYSANNLDPCSEELLYLKIDQR